MKEDSKTQVGNQGVNIEIEDVREQLADMALDQLLIKKENRRLLKENFSLKEEVGKLQNALQNRDK